jgi:hypothetical protein
MKLRGLGMPFTRTRRSLGDAADRRPTRRPCLLAASFATLVLLSPDRALAQGCTGASATQPFPYGMFGCAGAKQWPDRGTLCGAGYGVCSSAQWKAKRSGAVPSASYWTSDFLSYGGTGSGACFASPTAGTACAYSMRVCGGSSDAHGNACTWTGCGYETVTPNEYFGGACANPTAGTLCCPILAAPTGLRAAISSRSVTLTWDAAAGAVGYLVKRNGVALGAQPYTTAATTYTDVGVPNGSTHTYTVAAYDGSLGPESSPIGAVPVAGCRDARATVSFGKGMYGCAGVKTWTDRASLCAPGHSVCSAAEWMRKRGSSSPGYNFWTRDFLGYGGSGPNACHASLTVGDPSCVDSMRVCQQNPDALGNACNWTGCGYDAASPVEYFGGACGNTTAGTLCCLQEEDQAAYGPLAAGPAITGVNLQNTNQGYAFTPSRPLTVTALGGRFDGVRAVSLYDRDTGAVLASATVVGNTRTNEAWVDDAPLPAGANTEGTTWAWNAAVPPIDGALVHSDPAAPGAHQHYFNAPGPLGLPEEGDELYAWVYLDPSNPPTEIMLQWHDGVGGTWGHRAYWGANAIPWGTDGSPSRRYAGPLPLAGSWQQLRVPAADVGLASVPVTGMAFTQYGGKAYWDRAGVLRRFNYEPVTPVRLVPAKRYSVAVWFADTTGGVGYLQSFPRFTDDLTLDLMCSRTGSRAEPCSYYSSAAGPFGSGIKGIADFKYTYGEPLYRPLARAVIPDTTGPATATGRTMGFQFTPRKAITVTALGGLLSGARVLSLYDRATGARLAWAVATGSVRAAQAGDWTYAPIAPVNLTAGVPYTVAVEAAPGEDWTAFVAEDLPKTTPDASIDFGCFRDGSAAEPCSANAVTSAMYGIADLQYVSNTGLGAHTPQTFANTDQAYPYNMGYQFTPARPLTVTALGGLFHGTKTVRLYDSATGAVLASASVDGGGLTYAFAPIPPVELAAGRAYTVAVWLDGSGGNVYFLRFPVGNRDLTLNKSCRRANSATEPCGAEDDLYRMYGVADFQYSVAGNGIPEAGEQCDFGALDDASGGYCCTAAGRFSSAGTQCRAATEGCIGAALCTGGTATCPQSPYRPVGTVCRPSAGPCDSLEQCAASGPGRTECPPDRFASGGSSCRASRGSCDPAEACTGTGAECPADALAPRGRLCDVFGAGTCDGATEACPAAASLYGPMRANPDTVCQP